MRGSTFLHPPLRFRIDFPPTVGGRQQPAAGRGEGARTPTSSCCCSCVHEAAGAATSQDIALSQHAGRPASARVDGERTTINGLEAFVGVYQGQIEGLGDVTQPRRAHRARRQRLPGRRARRARPASSRRTARSSTAIRIFRPLSAAEADSHPARLASTSTSCAPATRGQSIAERSGGAIKPATLAVMNHVDAGVAAARRRADQDRGGGLKASARIRRRPARRCAGIGGRRRLA